MDSSSKFGSKLEIKKALPAEAQSISELKVIEAARRVTGQVTAPEKKRDNDKK